jgi:Tfp pilus assembly protein PilF
MDALKKAEHAKQQGQPGAPQATRPLELEPTVDTAKPEPVSLPELPLQLEVLDQQFIAHAEPAASRQPPPRPSPRNATKPEPTQQATTNAQATVQNVFAAKQQPGGDRRRNFAIVVGVATLLAAVGIGGYVWSELQPRHGVGLTASAPVSSRPAPLTPPQRTVALAPPAETPPTAPPAPAQAAPAALPPATTLARPAAPPMEQSGTADAPPIRITTARPKVNPVLTQAFEAFNAGSLEVARRAYEQVLKAEPKNADALHGMAAVALREGRLDQAEAYYLRILEADPKDSVAQASLVGLTSQSDPVATESRLKTALAGQPSVPHLHFALGNLYAAQRRWSDAQQAYFNAMNGDPTHPDYLFNLAVSLDQLHQDRLAAQYYGQALAAAAHRPAGFDQAQVVVRLRELQP